MRKFASIFAASAFVLAFTLPLATQAVPPKATKAPVATASAAAQEKPAPRERHPEIRAAIRQLETAKAGLQKYGAHDFGGHRVKAIEHIDQALAELHQALQYDKH
jgi:hypothetical protein